MKAKWNYLVRIFSIVLIMAVMMPASAAASQLPRPLNDGEVSDTPTVEASLAADETPSPDQASAADSGSAAPEISPTLTDGSGVTPTETSPTETPPPSPTETPIQSETLEAAAAPEPSPTAEEMMQFSSAQLSKMLGDGGADEMFQKVAGGGRLPVIVGLDVSFTPMGELSAPAANTQKENISRMQKQVIDDLAAKDVRNVKQFKYIPYMAMNVDEAGLKALIASGKVTSISIDKPDPVTLDVSVPLIGGTTAWGRGYTGSGRTVAILDTGVQKTHSFFGGRVVSEACYSSNYSGYSTSVCPGGVTASTASGSAMPYAGVCPSGECDHGTHVAGIAAGYYNPSFAGVAYQANIIAIQVFSRFEADYCYGSPCVMAWRSDQIAGLQRVYELRSTYNIDAANLSLGGGAYSSYCDSVEPAYKTAIDNLRSANIATVIASGNGGYSNLISFPACISSAVSVGATTDSDTIASFSNSASFLSLLAPGATIRSSVPNGGYESWGGTSMATPHVTGAWALLKHFKPNGTVSEILSALSTSGKPILDTRNGITKPRINVNSALYTFMPAKVVTISPTGTITDNNVPTYMWNALSDVVEYDFWLSDPAGMIFRNTYAPADVSCASGSGTCSLPQATPLANNTYRWWVRASNANGWGLWSDVRTFTIAVPLPAKATTVSPTGTITTTTTPTYVWNAIGSVIEYDFWLSDPSGMIFRNTYAPADVSCASGSGTCSLLQGTALPYTNYRWWVRARNIAGWGAWSNERAFTIAMPPAAKVTTVSPTGTITIAAPTYEWNAVSDAIQYEVQLNSASAVVFKTTYTPTQASCPSGSGACSLLQGTALNDGAYRWWVRAQNGGGWGAWSDERTFTIDLPKPPAKSTTVSPTGTLTTSNTPTYVWNAISDVTEYDFWLSDPAGMISRNTYTPADVSCSSGTGTCSLPQATPLANNTYRWWVRASNVNGWGAWSDVRTFTVSVSLPPKATTVSPTGTITNNTPTYVWNAIGSAIEYDFWLSDPSDMILRNTYAPADVSCASGTGTCSLLQGTALPYTNYRWWVRTRNIIGWSPWSDVRNFTVAMPPAAKVTTISPSGTVTISTPSYEWNAVSDAVQYEVQLNNATTMLFRTTYTPTQVSCPSGSGACSLLHGTALSDGSYRWWVRARNGGGWGAWSDLLTFTVDLPKPPPKPTTVSPTGTLTTSNTPTYVWNAISDVTEYDFWLSDPAGMIFNGTYTPADVSCSSGTGTCSLVQATTLANNTYRWWVRARNIAGWGSWSDVRTFTVSVPLPPKATLTSPSGTITSGTPTYVWNAIGNIIEYDFWLSDPAGMIFRNSYTPTDVSCPTGSGACSLVQPTPLANNSYRWWVRARNSVGWGAWSDVMSFTIAIP